MRVWLCALAEDSTLRFMLNLLPVSNRNKVLTSIIVSLAWIVVSLVLTPTKQALLVLGEFGERYLSIL